MGRSSEEEEARALLREYGTFVRKANHGDLYRLPGGRTMICYPEKRSASKSSMDWRAWKNTLAEIKRALRAEGILTNGDSEPDEPAEEDAMPNLTELGVHVEERSTVIRKTTKEATVPVKSVAALLGLVPLASDSLLIEVRDGDRVVFDQDDCLTISVVTSTVEEE